MLKLGKKDFKFRLEHFLSSVVYKLSTFTLHTNFISSCKPFVKLIKYSKI